MVYAGRIGSAAATHPEFEMLRVEKTETTIPISNGRHR